MHAACCWSGTTYARSHVLSKRQVAKTLAKYLVSPPLRALFALGIPVPGTLLLETIGRKSGRTRRTPVTNGLVTDVLWIVAEHGRAAAYVRNLEAEPRVRVLIAGRWRTGTARPLPDDDPRRRLRMLASARPRSLLNLLTIRLMATDLLTVRVDLDP